MRSRGERPRLPILLLAGAAILSVRDLASADPLGDPVNFFIGMAMVALWIAAIYATYTLVVWLLEALVLRLMLGIRYWRALGYAILINVSSLLIGMALRALLHESGWKAAVVNGDWSRVGLLLVRSFITALAVEGLLLLILLGRRFGNRRVLKTATLANALSYAITVPPLIIWVSNLFHR